MKLKNHMKFTNRAIKFQSISFNLYVTLVAILKKYYLKQPHLLFANMVGPKLLCVNCILCSILQIMVHVSESSATLLN